MTYEKVILIDGAEYPVTISDDPKTLLAAETAGRVLIGLRQKDADQLWLPADYVIELPEVSEGSAAIGSVGDTAGENDRGKWPDDMWLERVVRRRYGLPWEIARTERLIIREFTPADLPQVIHDPEDTQEDRIFQEAASLEAYIHSQYGFFECGMWAKKIRMRKQTKSEGEKSTQRMRKQGPRFTSWGIIFTRPTAGRVTQKKPVSVS